MAVKSYAVTVDTTAKTLATLLGSAPTNSGLGNANQPVVVEIQVPSAGQSVYVGDSAMTSAGAAANNYAIATGTGRVFKFRSAAEADSMFLVVAGTTQGIRVLTYLGD